MRKFTLLLILGLAFSLSTNAQVQKKVFLQEFTQASCAPCAAQNPAFDALVSRNFDKVDLIKFETWWPGFGPFYEQNPGENTPWIQFNGINSAPNVLIGGNALTSGGSFPGAPNGVTQAVIDNNYAQTTPINVEIDHEINSTLDSLTVNVTVSNVTDMAVSFPDMRLRINMVEREINFASPPGSNGETEFIHVARKFIPNIDGISLGDMIAPNEMKTFTEKIYIPNYLYRYKDIAVVAWVQTQGSRVVLQSATSLPKDITVPAGDVATVPNVETSDILCDLEISGSVDVTNEGAEDVTSMSLAFLVNGEAQGNYDWTGTLAPGESTSIDLPNGMVEPGGADVSVAVLRVNGARDTSRFNNQFATSLTKMYPEVYSTTLEEGFEQASRGDATPESAIMINPNGYRFFVVNRDQGGLNFPLGGFGQSEHCYRFDFYRIPAGGQGALIFRKIDLSEYKNSYLSFSYGYTNQTFQNDRLQVWVSADCGANWTEVFNKAGNDLKTANSVVGAWFYPRANDWVADTINISAFDGEGEVMVAFLGTSDAGNSLYLDDVALGQSLTGVVDAGILSGNVSVFPNPSEGPVNIQVDLEEAVTATIHVVDLTGRLVHTVTTSQSLTAGRHNFDWTGNVSNGIYMVKILTDKGQVTERITIAR